MDVAAEVDPSKRGRSLRGATAAQLQGPSRERKRDTRDTRDSKEQQHTLEWAAGGPGEESTRAANVREIEARRARLLPH